MTFTLFFSVIFASFKVKYSGLSFEISFAKNAENWLKSNEAVVVCSDKQSLKCRKLLQISSWFQFLFRMTAELD